MKPRSLRYTRGGRGGGEKGRLRRKKSGRMKQRNEYTFPPLTDRQFPDLLSCLSILLRSVSDHVDETTNCLD